MKLYIKEPTGATGVIETSVAINDLYRLYPADTIISETPFPVEEKAVEAVPVVEEKKPRAKAK